MNKDVKSYCQTFSFLSTSALWYGLADMHAQKERTRQSVEVLQ